jgi:hypothetical protein
MLGTSHPPLLYHSNNMWWSGHITKLSMGPCNFFQPYVTFALLDSNILLSTVNLLLSFNVRAIFTRIKAFLRSKIEVFLLGIAVHFHVVWSTVTGFTNRIPTGGRCGWYATFHRGRLLVL